jgi:hypothetical protein
MLNPIQIIQWQLSRATRVVPDSFKLLTTREWPRGLLVVYEVKCYLREKGTTFETFWCDLFEKKANVWLHIGGSGIGLDIPIRSEELVQYSHGFITGADGVSNAFAYGKTLSSEITSVEAVFNSGETVEDYTPDEVFAVALPSTLAVEELRLKNYRGEVIGIIQLN